MVGSASFALGRTFTMRVEFELVSGRKVALVAFYEVKKVRDTQDAWGNANTG